MDLSSRAVGSARPVMPTWTPSLKMRFASITSDGGALPAISRSSRTPKATKVNGGADESMSALAQLDRKNAKLRDEVITLKRQLEAARDGKLRARAQVEGMEGDLLDAKTVILSQQRAHAELKAKYYRVEGAMGALHSEGVLGSAGAAMTPMDSPGGLSVASSASRSRNSSGTEHFKGALAALTSENRKLKSRLQSQRKRERELERRIEQLEKDTRQRNAVAVGDNSDTPGASSDPTLAAVSSAAAALMTDESSPLWTLEPALRAVAIETAMESFAAQQRLKALDDGSASASQAELAAQVRSGAFGLLVKLRKMLTAMQQLVTHQDDLSPAEVVRVMVRALQTLVPSDRSAVWLVDRGRDQMWSVGALDFTYHVALDGGICGSVAQTGNVAMVEVAQDDPRFEPAIDDPSAMGQSSVNAGRGAGSGRAASPVHGEPAVKSHRPFSILAVPLGYLDEPMTHAPVMHGRHSHATHKGVIGVLEIVRDAPGKGEAPRAKAWDDMELALVSIFAEVAGPLLHHAQIAAKTRRYSEGMEALLTMPHAAAEEAALLEAARIGALSSAERSDTGRADKMVGVVKQMEVVLESALQVEGVRVFVVGDVDNTVEVAPGTPLMGEEERMPPRRMWWIQHELDDDGVNHHAMRAWSNTTSALAGHVATTAEPLLLSDALNDVYFNSNIDLNPKFSPMLTVPVMDHLGNVVAVMQLRTGDARNFVSADSTQILKLCTRQISYVLGHHNALEEVSK